MSTELVYKNYKWTLTVNGVDIPNTHVIYDGLSMKNDEVPTVEIKVDSVDIEDLGIEVSKNDTPRN